MDTFKKTVSNLKVEKWHLHVKIIQFYLNQKIVQLTGNCPFSLMYGRQPNRFIHYSKDNICYNEQETERIIKDKWERLYMQIFPDINRRVKERNKISNIDFEKSHEMIELDKFKVGQIVFIRPGEDFNKKINAKSKDR